MAPQRDDEDSDRASRSRGPQAGRPGALGSRTCGKLLGPEMADEGDGQDARDVRQHVLRYQRQGQLGNALDLLHGARKSEWRSCPQHLRDAERRQRGRPIEFERLLLLPGHGPRAAHTSRQESASSGLSTAGASPSNGSKRRPALSPSYSRSGVNPATIPSGGSPATAPADSRCGGAAPGGPAGARGGPCPPSAPAPPILLSSS